MNDDLLADRQADLLQKREEKARNISLTSVKLDLNFHPSIIKKETGNTIAAVWKALSGYWFSFFILLFFICLHRSVYACICIFTFPVESHQKYKQEGLRVFMLD